MGGIVREPGKLSRRRLTARSLSLSFAVGLAFIRPPRRSFGPPDRREALRRLLERVLFYIMFFGCFSFHRPDTASMRAFMAYGWKDMPMEWDVDYTDLF